MVRYAGLFTVKTSKITITFCNVIISNLSILVERVFFCHKEAVWNSMRHGISIVQEENTMPDYSIPFFSGEQVTTIVNGNYNPIFLDVQTPVELSLIHI